MRYTVRPGDTLSKIAAAHGTTLEALLGANPRYRQHPERIQVGDAIVVPGDDPPGLAEAAAPVTCSPSVPRRQ